MKMRVYGFITLLSGLAYAGTPPPNFLPSNLPDLVEKILPSVVNVSSTTMTASAPPGFEDFLRYWGIPKERKQSSLGSGVVIHAQKGLVLTNNHVIEHADEFQVILNDKRQYLAKVIGSDSKLDLALLQIQDSKSVVPQNLSAATLGDSDKVRIAEPVLAIGNPFGLQHTVTMGIISAKNRTIGLGPFDNFLQTDASINPGNSGGPLFNTKGEVIGINNAIDARAHGIGFAIPINEAIKIIPNLERYGRVPRAWLGIMAEKVTPTLARYYRLPRKDGVVIYNLVNDAPADRAGVKIGDILTKIGDHAITEPVEVERAISSKKPGESATITVQRGGRELQLKTPLTEYPVKLEDRLPHGIL